MSQPYPNPHEPRGVDEQTTRIPQYQPGTSQAPPVAPAKKKRRWPWIVGGVVALFVVIQIANGGGDTPTPAPAADGAAIPAVNAPAAPVPAPAAPVAPAPAPVAPPAPAEPQMTVSQENALRSAENYLSIAGFSRSGLISQLEFEEYSTADAEFAVDNVTVDWMEQAARSAKNYMDISAFSRSGLIGQLEFEGYTTEQAEFGADSVGL